MLLLLFIIIIIVVVVMKVHYVPLTYSGADIVEKIKWLKNNDDLAQRIAKNGNNNNK